MSSGSHTLLGRMEVFADTTTTRTKGLVSPRDPTLPSYPPTPHRVLLNPVLDGVWSQTQDGAGSGPERRERHVGVCPREGDRSRKSPQGSPRDDESPGPCTRRRTLFTSVSPPPSTDRDPWDGATSKIVWVQSHRGLPTLLRHRGVSSNSCRLSTTPSHEGV